MPLQIIRQDITKMRVDAIVNTTKVYGVITDIITESFPTKYEL